MAVGQAEKQVRVDELKAAILAGTAEAEGLDATNPERQRMMEAWCESDDPARMSERRSAFVCAKAKAKADFLKRREVSEHFACNSRTPRLHLVPRARFTSLPSHVRPAGAARVLVHGAWARQQPKV